MIITIDGPAGSGKSTVANILSGKLNFIHFNSGMIFRSITAYLLDIKFDINSITETSFIPQLNLKVEMKDNTQQVFVNGLNYSSILRSVEVSNVVSSISLNENIQKIAQTCIKDFCNRNNVVVDGRGVGSTMFPNADYKFYLDCSVKERAKRRFLEDKNKENCLSLTEMETLIEERDRLDRERATAPLVVPENAIIIDSTNLSIEQVVESIYNHIIR